MNAFRWQDPLWLLLVPVVLLGVWVGYHRRQAAVIYSP